MKLRRKPWVRRGTRIYPGSTDLNIFSKQHNLFIIYNSIYNAYLLQNIFQVFVSYSAHDERGVILYS